MVFTEYSTNDSLFTICVTWPHMVTHLLVIVNVNGQLRHICILHRHDRSLVNSLKWLSFSRWNSYKIVVCGLKMDTCGLSSTEYLLYSVEGVDMWGPKVFSGGIFQPDLQGGTGHCLMGSLGHQTDLSVKEIFTPPMSHNLEMKLAEDIKGLMCIVYNQREKKEQLIVVPSLKSLFLFRPIQLPLPIQQSRTIYTVQVVPFNFSKKFRLIGEEDLVVSLYGASGKSGVLVVKSTNSKQDLQKLMMKAEGYCRRNQRPDRSNTVDSFNRTKLQQQYYSDILNNKGGIMRKYIKDNNGDPHTPINNKINGLFFSGTTESIAPFSYFGDCRMFVPADELITQNTRMYFADFYCHYKTHYVTVVLTLRGSPEDTFCERSLLELDLKDNPFFTVKEVHTYQYSYPPVLDFYSQRLSSSRRNPYAQLYPQPHARPCIVTSRSFRMVSVNKFHVEFLYTENVDIRKRRFEHVKCKGVSKPDGIPKDVDCTICNLEPKPPTAGFASLNLLDDI